VRAAQRILADAGVLAGGVPDLRHTLLREARLYSLCPLRLPGGADARSSLALVAQRWSVSI
jgi:hypothetical protein